MQNEKSNNTNNIVLNLEEIKKAYIESLFKAGIPDDLTDATNKAEILTLDTIIAAVRAGAQIEPKDLAELRRIYLDRNKEITFHPPLENNEMKIHAIKDIQSFEIARQQSKKDHNIETRVLEAMCGAAGLYALICGISNGTFEGPLLMTGMLAALAILSRIINHSLEKSHPKNINRVRKFYNISPEEELQILDCLIDTQNEKASELYLVNSYINGLSDGTYKVELDDNGKLNIIPKDREMSPGKGV